MKKFEVGAAYKIIEETHWLIKHGPYQSGYYTILFPSTPKISKPGDLILILEKIKDKDPNHKIELFGGKTYSCLLPSGEIVYMYMLGINKNFCKFGIKNEN